MIQWSNRFWINFWLVFLFYWIHNEVRLFWLFYWVAHDTPLIRFMIPTNYTILWQTTGLNRYSFSHNRISLDWIISNFSKRKVDVCVQVIWIKIECLLSHYMVNYLLIDLKTTKFDTVLRNSKNCSEKIIVF